MMRHRIGVKPLRLLILMAMIVCFICGCSSSKYHPLEPVLSTDQSQAGAEPVAFTIANASLEEDMAVQNDAQKADDETAEAIRYQEIHDWVVVTADALNVRAADNTKARIYVQLHTGDRLERIGYHEEWSQVIYDGDVAYVATSMVEVAEDPAVVEEHAAEAAVVAEVTELSEHAAIQVAAEDSLENEEQIVGEGTTDEHINIEDSLSKYTKTGTVETEISEEIWNGHVIAIDAGHQAKANAEKEPIGPGSSTKKAKMPEGAVGATTGVKEYELTLNIAKQLETELKERGYKIIMIRTGHDVNLSNAERSVIANKSDAEILIRLHANAMDNSGIYGALAMCMTELNPYNSELHADSYSLSKKIINNICKLTGTKNRGVQKVDNSASINWCEIPVSVVEMGFLTNPDEDRWLQTPEYQGKIVKGISDAVDSYFSEKQN